MRHTNRTDIVILHPQVYLACLGSQGCRRSHNSEEYTIQYNAYLNLTDPLVTLRNGLVTEVPLVRPTNYSKATVPAL